MSGGIFLLFPLLMINMELFSRTKEKAAAPFLFANLAMIVEASVHETQTDEERSGAEVVIEGGSGAAGVTSAFGWGRR